MFEARQGNHKLVQLRAEARNLANVWKKPKKPVENEYIAIHEEAKSQESVTFPMSTFKAGILK